MEYSELKTSWIRYFKSGLLSLDLILGFAAVTYSYQWYVSRSADTLSSLVMILTGLGYFIFYPYYVIKLIEKDKMKAMASIYTNMIISRIKKDETKEDENETKEDDNSR